MIERIPEFIGNHLILISAFLAVLAILLGSEFVRRRGAPASLTPESVVALMNNGSPVILDTRPASDFRKGHIIGARNIAVDQLASSAGKFGNDTVVVYDANGMTASRGAAALTAAGVSNVATLKGGLAAWRDSKLPLSKPNSKPANKAAKQAVAKADSK